MVEAVVSTMLVGILMVTALKSLGASKRQATDGMTRLLGQQLAGAMMNEILLQSYQEPDTSQAPVFGPEPGESTGNRSLFDDVDDYVNYSSSPPQDRSGTAIPGFTGWTRNVSVIWADPATYGSTAAQNTGLKKITVTVTKGGKTYGSIVGYRSIAWVDTIPTPTDATGNHAPIAIATASSWFKQIWQPITFNATTSSDQDGDYISYVWNYGDGTTATGATVVKSYSTPGNYTCTLTVYDGRGGVGTSALSIVITF